MNEQTMTNVNIPTASGAPDATLEPFTFSSRSFGLILMAVLAANAISLLLVLALAPQGIWGSSEISELTPGVVLWGISLLFSVLTSIICTVVFLLWLYKVHQDLGRLFGWYPISPSGAVIRVSVPLYNIYGIWKVFMTIAGDLVSNLKPWVYAYYLAPLLLGLAGMLILGTKNAMIEYITGLGSVAVWFVMTFMIHRALGRSNGNDASV